MTLDEALTRVQGAVDLMRGREDAGWRRLDLTADGFWNSFLAIPLCIPALVVVWISHAQWLAANGGEGRLPGTLVSLAAIDLIGWVATLAALVPLASVLGWRERLVATIIATNWASVVFAYAQAVPRALSLLVGSGPGIAFITLIVTLGVLAAYWRLLAASIGRATLAVAATFIATFALGYLISAQGQAMLGMLPPAP